MKNDKTTKHPNLICETLKEADFFLEKMTSSSRRADELNYYFSAFVSAARSVTFVIQYVGSAIKGFDKWYSNIQERLKNDIVSKYLLEARNESQKTGAQPISYSKVIRLPSGEGRPVYFFSYVGSTPRAEVPSLDVLSECQQQMKNLASIVSEFLDKFESKVWDPSKERLDTLRYLNQVKPLMCGGDTPEALWRQFSEYIANFDFEPLRPSKRISNLLAKYVPNT